MPTDPSINLSTSAAAAFCARLCVHPRKLLHFASVVPVFLINAFLF